MAKDKSRRGLIYHVRMRPRFYSMLILVFVLGLGLSRFMAPSIAVLLSWNLSVAVFLAQILRLMFTADDAQMKNRAQAMDEGQAATLFLSLAATVASFVATVMVLSQAKEMAGTGAALHTALSALTVVSSWSFIHVIFAEHYAHEYYLALGPGVADGGLRFPDETAPDYVDFLYFSFTIGVAAQTADVSVSSRTMRRTVLLQSVIAYIFNAFILALTINIASTLL